MNRAWLAFIGLLTCQVFADTLPYYGEETHTPTWSEDGGFEEVFAHQVSSFVLEDQNGDPIEEDALKGKVWLANFFFSTCPGICSKVTVNLKRVQETHGENERVRMVSYSVTPAIDNADRLKEYEKRHDISGEQWSLVTGDKKVIYGLARDSFFAKEGLIESEDQFLHSEKVFLVDWTGRIRGVYNGVMTVDMERIIKDIDTLLEELDAL